MLRFWRIILTVSIEGPEYKGEGVVETSNWSPSIVGGLKYNESLLIVFDKPTVAKYTYVNV